MLLKLANFFEKLSIILKKRRNSIYRDKFLNKFNLKDSKPTKKVTMEYNPYEGTNLFLIDELIRSKEIVRDNHILDIGSGTGIFLIYLLNQGFCNLYGYEIDRSLYELSMINLESYRNSNNHQKSNVNFKYCDVFDKEIEDNIDVFVLYNTFFGKETYKKLLSLIKKSINRNPRTIKVIIQYPTVASIGALRETDWLYEKGKVTCDGQVCWRCLYYLIYESKGEML